MKSYSELAAEVAALVEEKQQSYGDSFGKSVNVLKELYPMGIPPEKLGDALTIVRIVDKLFRIANQKDAHGESPYRDINGYSLLALKRDEDALPNTVFVSGVFAPGCPHAFSEWVKGGEQCTGCGRFKMEDGRWL